LYYGEDECGAGAMMIHPRCIMWAMAAKIDAGNDDDAGGDDDDDDPSVYTCGRWRRGNARIR
jgi:hypothetical protein